MITSTLRDILSIEEPVVPGIDPLSDKCQIITRKSKTRDENTPKVQLIWSP